MVSGFFSEGSVDQWPWKLRVGGQRPPRCHAVHGVQAEGGARVEGLGFMVQGLGFRVLRFQGRTNGLSIWGILFRF